MDGTALAFAEGAFGTARARTANSLIRPQLTQEEILNYFVERETSGFVEGFNNRLKVLKRRCYCIFNVDHLFQRISLDLDAARILGA
jgi:transposase